MVLDASALIAILMEEPGFLTIAGKINAASTVIIGAPTAFEAAMVLQKKVKDHAGLRLKEFLDAEDIRIVDFGEEHYRLALSALLRYGKGRHPAQLNFGDCLSYAVAAVADMPLLYTGDDFSKTDIEAA
jgi:ribonuclease VapC